MNSRRHAADWMKEPMLAFGLQSLTIHERSWARV
jgi:hypothetical protein